MGADRKAWLRLLEAAGLFFIIAMPSRSALELVPGVTQIRPENMLGPVLGLLWGLPGALGAALGNLGTDLLWGTPWYVCAGGMAINVLYGYIPYVIWYWRKSSSEVPGPFMDNGASVLRFIVIMAVDSLLTAALLTALFTAAGAAEAGDIFGLLFFNNFDFSVILGVLVLAALGRSRRGYKAHVLKTRFIRGFLGLCSMFLVLILALAFRAGGQLGTLERWDYIFRSAGLGINVVFFLTIAFMWYMEGHVAVPLERLAAGASAFSSQVREGTPAEKLKLPDFSYIRTGDEIEILADTVSSMMRNMVQYMKTIREGAAERERIRAELSAAARIQKNMVPQGMLSLGREGCGEVYGQMDPAREVGGDFYDYFMVDESRAAVVIGDVSGKGISAALFMAMVQTLIRARLQAGLGPGKTFSAVNEALAQANASGMFATAWAGILELDTGRCTWASAGHNSPVTGRPGQMKYMETDRPDLVLAGLEGAVYQERELMLKPGDSVLLYTDGVTEAENGRGEFFGEERLCGLLNGTDVSCGLKGLWEIRRALAEFAGDEEQSDDITMVRLEYSGPADFALTAALKEADQKLYQRYLDGAGAAAVMLERYKAIFPDFTDHSCIHSIRIMELAARLAGNQLYRLGGGGLYVLLTGILFHDLGMGISGEDLKELAPLVCAQEWAACRGPEDEADLIRRHHHEFSARLMEKYADFLEIQKEYLWAAGQAARGHRKTDLMDPGEYPADLVIRGERICLPLIAGLIRLADELDLCCERSGFLGRAGRAVNDPYSRLVWRTHGTVKRLDIQAEEFVIVEEGADEETHRELQKWAGKLQAVSDEVWMAVEQRTAFFLPKRGVRIMREPGLPV